MAKLNVCEICGKPIEGRQRKLCPECARNPYKGVRKKTPKQEKKPAAKPEKINRRQCEKCRFYNRYYEMCDYFEMTGQLRNCELSPNCTKFERG